MLQRLGNLSEDMLNFFFPQLCAGCDAHLLKGEDCICLLCQLSMPLTRFERYGDNPVMKQFWGKIPLHAATAYCHFNKGSKVQQMIHHLKYEGRQDVGVKLGQMFAHELISSHWQSDIQWIVPVPLHASRLRARGYNQAASIAQGLSAVLNIPLKETALVRKRKTATQTRKSRFERAGNVMDVFEAMDGELLRGKHILLVDDVITTGSTLVSAAEALWEVPDIKLSIVALAFARL